jgi:predicted esterase YcpF (UPF0227 family)
LSLHRNRPGMYIYLHGFNSSGDSAKGKFFSHALAPVVVHTPSYPPDPDEAVTYLRHTLEGLMPAAQARDPVILIGSSLGGFYAQYLARQFNLATVLINPALQPRDTLTPYFGWQTNFYTGEQFYFDEQVLTRLQQYDIPDPCAAPVPTLVLLDAGDELIDYHYAHQLYKPCAQVIVYPDGDHEFQHVNEAAIAIQHFRQENLVEKP